jgi:hypothetical protein
MRRRKRAEDRQDPDSGDVRNTRGQFVSDLRAAGLVDEDSIKQDIASRTLSHGGRIYNQLAPPTAAGRILDAGRMGGSPLGRGRVLLFGPEINFRAQPHGTFKFLFNGIYYGKAVSTRIQ